MAVRKALTYFCFGREFWLSRRDAEQSPLSRVAMAFRSLVMIPDVVQLKG